MYVSINLIVRSFSLSDIHALVALIRHDRGALPLSHAQDAPDTI
jgi:hypothetical protein